jgi:Domain of unknown function (DUF4407)
MNPFDSAKVEATSSSTAPPVYNLLIRFLLWIVGVDKKILATQCRPQDVSTIAAQGALLIGSISLTAGILILISHRLFGEPGHLDPRLVTGSLAIAGLIGAVDAYCFYRASWFDAGVQSLSEWGGLAVTSSASKYTASVLKFAVRAAISVPLSLLSGLFLGVTVYYADISSIIQRDYLRNNSAIFARAATSVDEAIGHTAKSIKVKETEIDALSNQLTSIRGNAIDPTSKLDDASAQRELDALLSQKAAADEDVRRSETTQALERGGISGPRTSGVAGNGPRFRAAVQEVANAKAHAQQVGEALAAARVRLEKQREKDAVATAEAKQRAERGVPAFEEKLRLANLDLSRLKDQLNELTQNRNETIRRSVETSPSQVKSNDGVLAQIMALGELANKDGKIALTIWLFELAAVALELAAVCSKALVHIPTDYSKVVAKDAILHSVKMVDEMMADISAATKKPDASSDAPPWGKPGNDNFPSKGPNIDVTPDKGSEDPPSPPPPKRGRGRPRKPRLLN